MAEALKDKGNTCFKEGKFAEAITFFTEALSLDSDNAAYYSNRSLAHIKKGDKAAALADAEQCIKLRPEWDKGYARKAVALLLMGDSAQAVETYTAGIMQQPESQILLDGLEAAQKAMNKKKKKKKRKGKKKNVEESKEGDAKSYVIGIDLGTTYSCVGVWMDDKVHIIENMSGQRTIPSYVCFDPESGERWVGHAAKNQATRLPQNVVYDVKRIIGQRWNDSGVQGDVEKMQYEVVKNEEGNPMVKVVVQGETLTFAPEEISAMVLSYCKEQAEKFLGAPVTRAVVTVPAYFNDSQRNATKVAGQIAGLDVLRIINEPTAAALSYGLDNAIISKNKPLNVLIFDLGGGTFDVSILTIEGGLFTVKATGGDTRLGGEDFDNTLIDHLLSEVDRQGIPDPRTDSRAIQRLRKAAEKCKRELSSLHKTEIRLEGFMGKHTFHTTVSRKKFEALNNSRFIICMDVVQRVLKDAKLKNNAIDEIVLVGGSTRIPKLQSMLTDFFGGKVLCKSLNPDEAVAHGAAIQAAILSGMRNTKTDNLLLMDVTPLSLGIEIEGCVMSVVIPRNSPIPCIKTQTYTTERDNQTEDTVPVYEGERLRADENNLLGKFTITGIEKAKKGVPQIDVTFSIDSNGILEVTAKDQKTGASTNITIANRSRATTDQIDHMVSEAAKHKKADEERLRRVQSRQALEETIYETLETANEIKDEKIAGILKKAAEKELSWLQDESEGAEAKDFSLRRITLQRRLDGKR